MGKPWVLKLSVILVAATFGVTGATVVAQASPTTLNWGQVTTSQNPPGREFGAMAFDSFRNRTVLWGGGNAAFNNLNDTWEFDGANWAQSTPATSPPALVGSAMAFDATRNVSVLFGGSAPAGDSAATWEWDGTNWVPRSLATAPSARLWMAMAYDSTRHRIVLFGGSGVVGGMRTYLNDTWEYDGSNWNLMTPASSPSARIGTMAFDPGLGRVVLFGGRDNGGNRLNDTWQWDGMTWTQVTPNIPLTPPYQRFWHSMAFDSQVGHVVMFGGDHIQAYGLGPVNDTWQWDGTRWTQDWTAAAPSARAGQTMALDANGRVMMFGGSDEGYPVGVFPTETWELGNGITTPPGNPDVTFNPTSMDFGSVDIGVTSAADHIFVHSSGTGPLLATISISGDFAISSTDCPSTPDPLAAGSNCFVFVTFTPTGAGDRFGSLVFTDNGPGGSQSLPLHGIGVGSDFSMSASPSSLSMFPGSSATSTISTTVIGSAGTVTLSALTNDPGVTATFSPTSIPAGGASTMTVMVASTVAPGFYGVRAVGAEGAITHYTDVSVTVIAPPDFSISASLSSLSVVQGSTATSTIGTTQIGSSGSIALSASVAPGGLTATLNPTFVSAGGSSTLTVGATNSTSPGSYTVTVTGTEGSTTHSTSVAVTVTPKGIVNGGFETGDFTGWTVTGKTAIVKTPHAGKFAARVGSTSPSTASTLAQIFSVPAAGGKLSFWYRMTCPDWLANDWFTVTLHDSATGVTTTLKPRVCSTTGWTHVTANVSAHAGHSVTLTFLNHDDNQSGDATFTLVDDVTLT